MHQYLEAYTMTNDIKERLEIAFKQAKILEEVKKDALSTFDMISEQLYEITGGHVKFATRIYRLAGFDTQNFIHIRHIHDSEGVRDIRLLGYEIDPIKGFPVVIETNETKDSYMNKISLSNAVLDTVTNEVVMDKILKMISAFELSEKNIPF